MEGDRDLVAAISSARAASWTGPGRGQRHPTILVNGTIAPDATTVQGLLAAVNAAAKT
jgi:hypothetical protein